MDVQSYYQLLLDFVNSEHFYTFLRIALLLGFGVPIVSFVARMISNFSKNYGSPHMQLLIKRGVYYMGMVFIIVSILNELGFHISALLGAAGIAGAALAFASQTSVSHVISGLFLISERSFSIGDVVEVEGVMGNVESIDLLSIKLRTFDQKLVRIPNETLIKKSMNNISYFPHRRLNFNVSIPHTQDVRTVIDLLTKVVAANEFSDKEREPLIYLKEHTNDGLSIFVGAYARQKNYFSMLKSLSLEIKEAFDKHNIDMPAQRLSVVLVEKPQA